MIFPQWLLPPMPAFEGSVRTVTQDWGEYVVRLTKAKQQGELPKKGESKRLNALWLIVKTYPGSTAGEIQKYTPENVNWMLRNLKRAGRIRVEGRRNFFRYYAIEGTETGADAV